MTNKELFQRYMDKYAIKPVFGIFPHKPVTAESIYKTLNNGYMPIDEKYIIRYAMPSNRDMRDMGYYYIEKQYCRQMTYGERKDWQEFSDERKAWQSEKRKERQKESVINRKTDPIDFEEIAGKNIVCFDTETTGVSNNDEIIQITIATLVPYEEKGRVKTLFSDYIEPIHHTQWKEAMAVNGITPAMVNNKKPLKFYEDFIKEIFNNADYICGYNVKFDIRMLKNGIDIDIPEEKIIDPLDVFKKDIPSGSHKLIDAVTEYLRDKPEKIEWFKSHAHDATADTAMTLMVLYEQGMRKGIDIINDNRDKEYETSLN